MKKEQLKNPPELVEVSDPYLAFPAEVIGIVLPKYEDTPEKFKDRNHELTEVARRLFFDGGKNWKFYPKKGVDAEKAWRMIVACLRSFQPKHEHKEAGVAYLMDTFFDKVERIEPEETTRRT
jgi:hypothetical protein